MIMKYSLNDISIVPAKLSTIDSRSQCCPYHEDGMLPLFTAPMSSVVDLNNYKLFKENKINPIIPRTVNLDDRINLCNNTWCAFSLNEFISLSEKFPSMEGEKFYILIDIANGNMKKLYTAIYKAKSENKDRLVIMAGNIANPETYELLSDSGADYVRLGIGTGSVCITASNTAIYYPLASLIKECYDISFNLENPAKIIADGGIKGFSDIIKSLALGADYVMCGSIFNKMIESSGKSFYNGVEISREDSISKYLFQDKEIYKEHYGMSTKKAQKELGSNNLKTSEGIHKMQKVEYSMPGWCENFSDYLKSAMSYTSSYDLYDFIGEVKTVIISNNGYNVINK